MKQFVHILSLTIYLLIIIITTGILIYLGYSFYILPETERFYHPMYQLLKSSGFLGHGLGIFGTLIMLTGMVVYIARKRLHVFSRAGALKYWLEFHIFTCTLGPILVLFHTSFKFGGIASIGFWSMALVWASGVIGRFLYLEIPRTINGKELSLNEVLEIKKKLIIELSKKYEIDFSNLESNDFSKNELQLFSSLISNTDFKRLKGTLRNQVILSQRIGRLEKMKQLFKHWHIVHLPFSIVMVIIMVIHVIIVLTLGYKWIF